MTESDFEPSLDYLSEDDLQEQGVDPALVRSLCPHATELTGHDGIRCWAAIDLTPLLEGNKP